MKKKNDLTPFQLSQLIFGMRKAYKNGKNAMAFSRSYMSDYSEGKNKTIATLVAYDLQSGSYVDGVRKNLEYNGNWCRQVANLIEPVLPINGTILEVGVGEVTTLAGVLDELGGKVGKALGFDISWSRIKVGKDWLTERGQTAELFVGDLTHIPMADNSVDVVYSSHSLEPNGGNERSIISECLRVARSHVILVEPIYELATPTAQDRMRQHGYVQGLNKAATELDAKVLRFELLPVCSNSLNPSGVVVLQKQIRLDHGLPTNECFQCPITRTPLVDLGDAYFAPEVGLAYPLLRDIPLLRPEHAVVASLLSGRARELK